MALYLGNSEKLKITESNNFHHLYVGTKMTNKNNIRLLSSDGYILKDKNGVYLIPKESE